MTPRHYYNEIEPGARFGSLVVTVVKRGAKSVHPTAVCVCDCGTESTHRVTRLRTGKATRCYGCARKATWMNRARPTVKDKAVRRLIDTYAENAKRRNLEFALTPSACEQLFSAPCNYCGAFPSRMVKAKGCGYGAYLNGIDRIDNSIGYVTGNVAACCTQCNYAKRELSVSEFLNWVSRIASHSIGDMR
jgi:hypothetical protein